MLLPDRLSCEPHHRTINNAYEMFCGQVHAPTPPQKVVLEPLQFGHASLNSAVVCGHWFWVVTRPLILSVLRGRSTLFLREAPASILFPSSAQCVASVSVHISGAGTYPGRAYMCVGGKGGGSPPPGRFIVDDGV